MPLFGLPNVQKMQAKGDLNGLCNALAFKDPAIRANAAKALGEIGNSAYAKDLIPLLGDGSPDARVATVEALRTLMKRGETDWWTLRVYAKEKFGNTEMLDPVLVDNESAVAPILERFANMRWSELGERHDHMKDMKHGILQVGKAAVAPLMAATKHENSEIRSFAIEMLGLIGDPRAVELLLSTLETGLAKLKLKTEGAGPAVHAIEALGRIGDARAFDSLLSALQERFNDIRASAAEALGRLGDQRAIKTLVKALSDVDRGDGICDQDLRVREKAALALDALGWQPTNDSAGAAYWVAKHQWVKCADLGPDAVEPLIYALAAADGNDKRYARDVAQVLGKLGAETVASRLECTNHWPRRFQSFAKERLLYYDVLVAKPVSGEEEARMLNVLGDLCHAYAANDTAQIANLERAARRIGEELNGMGGMKEMRRVFGKLGDRRGSRTLEMLWKGIGAWQG